MPQTEIRPGAAPHECCHIMVREVALSLCAEQYEIVMGDNKVRNRWKARNPGAPAAALLNRFLNKYWAAYIPAARATMAHLLTGPLPEDVKDDIHEALLADTSLRVGTMPGPTSEGIN
jgi:hypothetical protein